MHVWITARRIREGMMEDFLKAWQDPGVGWPVSPASPEGPTVYALRPTDDPNEMWGVGFFDSEDDLRRMRESPRMARRAEALSPFVADILWERTFDAHPWSEADRPLVYAVYFRQNPRRLYKLVAICPNVRQAVEEGDSLMGRARSTGLTEPQWTMRAFHDGSEAPESLPRLEEGHTHAAAQAMSQAP